MIQLGKTISAHLVDHIFRRKDELLEVDRDWLVTLATAPIVSRANDSTCTVSYAEGLIRKMKINGWGESEFKTFRQLFVSVDCVDKGVMKEAIDLGFNYTNDYTKALSMVSLIYPIMLQRSDMDKNQISDTRVAFAIRAGLIEIY
jgi:hypothetical protein